MDRNNFLANIKKIFENEGIVSYDEALFNKFLENEKKNSVVTIAQLGDGKEVFFKAIKPWAQAQGFLDYEKGLLTYKLLEKSGFTHYPHVVNTDRLEDVNYIITSVVPIADTITDVRLLTLESDYARRILQLYRDSQKQTQIYLENHLSEVAFLLPLSNFSQQFSFWGQMVLFEENLYRQKHIEKKKIADAVFELIKTNHKKENNQPFLLHGDFSPHNIICGREIYFIDWERCLVVFDPLIGQNYDIANLYIYSYQNPDFQNELFEDSQSFRLCLAYHLLYKANYILTFNIEKDKPLLAWCVEKIKEVDLG